MDVKFLTNQIALLLPVRGQTEFRKLTASDSPHPIPLLAHLLPPPSFLLTPGALLRSTAYSLTCSTSPPGKGEKDDILTILDSETERIKNGTQWHHVAQGIPRFLNWMKSFCDTPIFLSSNRHPTYLTWKTWVQRRFGGNVPICCLIFLILIPVSF